MAAPTPTAAAAPGSSRGVLRLLRSSAPRSAPAFAASASSGARPVTVVRARSRPAAPELVEQSVNTIRFLAVDAVEKAQSGHPGLPMGCAPLGHVLFDEFLRFNPKNPAWFDRDRFVLSAGHGCMLQYALLYLAGYEGVTMDDLKAFRQWRSSTPGHPENFETPGVEVTTGPLGQGFANAVGLALAEKHLAARFNKTDLKIVDHYTYVILGDGCQMEGISNEAASLAGHWGLGKLIAFYDDNHISIDGSTDIAFTEDVLARYEALGWHTIWVKNGNTGYADIRAAIKEAKGVIDKPTLIKVTTTIGFGSPNKANTYSVHGSALGSKEVEATRSNLGWFHEPFHVPDEVKRSNQRAISASSGVCRLAPCAQGTTIARDMAEAIAISLSAKLAVALSRTAAVGLSLLFGVRSDIAAAAQDLDLLRAFLRSADSRRGTDALAAAWVQQVRDTAFDHEDVADECCYLSGHGRGWVNARAWFALSRRLRKARERLRQLAAAKEQYGIRQHQGDADGSPPPVAAVRRLVAERAHFLKREEVVGFDEHEKQLLEWVAADSEPRRTTLVAVWGMGGVGKTTLVTRVYNEAAASHFERAAWVAVSQAFTLDDLLRKIAKELCRDGGGDAPASGGSDADADYRSLVGAVHGHLRQRRYLVVLDDVWDAQLWNKLRHAFLDDANGSRVVITTRSRDVAKAAAADRTMTLEPLPWRDSWSLFCNVAFREVPGRTCPSHLEELAANMLRRCCGLPLAIVSLGNLLALKDRTEFAWRNVQNSLVWDESSSHLGIGDAASILNLSIDDLPHQIKRCLLSCSIYPEDFLIKRKIQIRMWVARGFIEETPGQCIAEEDVADDYLDQLVQRSLVQAVTRNEFGRAKSFIIHDLIRELIIHKSREQEGFFQFVKCKVAIDNDIRIRHLAVDRCEEVDSQHVRPLATLRSFIALGSELDASFLSHFRLLTVLNLWFIAIDRLPDSVANLHNLRYLGIRSTLVEHLPKELGKLQKLQTLDAKLSRVRRLPSSAVKLKSLRHLILFTRGAADFSVLSPAMAVQVPNGLENLCSLQTLKYVRADMSTVRSLAKMEQMRSLELFGVNSSCNMKLSSSISRMNRLLRLGLQTEPAGDASLDLDSVCPPPLKLQSFTLDGSLAHGKLPSWTCSLTSLVQLWLCDSGIAQDSLVVLAKLPRLANLALIAAYWGTSMTFAEGSFPTLQRLTLQDLPNLSHIEFQEGCLQNLRDLVLVQCKSLTETPRGMQNLVHLQNLNLLGMPNEFVNSLKQQDGYDAYYKPDNSEFLRVNGPLRHWRWIGRNKSKTSTLRCTMTSYPSFLLNL